MTRENLLILTKTYPTPSAKYIETTCVAAVTENGQLRRVYPFPFRLLEEEKQFKKWQWVTVNVGTPNDDHRPESRRVDVDNVQRGEVVTTGKGKWQERIGWLTPHVVPSYAELETRRLATGETLGVLRPSRLLELMITARSAKEQDWTDEEKVKLTRDLMQPDLFTDPHAYRPPILQKIPYTFHYRYEIDMPTV